MQGIFDKMSSRKPSKPELSSGLRISAKSFGEEQGTYFAECDKIFIAIDELAFLSG